MYCTYCDDKRPAAQIVECTSPSSMRIATRSDDSRAHRSPRLAVFLRSDASVSNLVTDDDRSPAAVRVWSIYNSSR